MGGPKAVAAAIVILAGLSAACAGGGSGDGASGGGSGGGSAALESALRPARQSAAADLQTRAAEAPALPALGPRVIKTATIDVGVAGARVEAAVQEATAVAGRFGGFVASTSLTAGTEPHATVLIRVPADDFEPALQALEELGKVERHSVSGEDVSQEFVDLEARLRHWRSQEVVLLRLMDRARSVSDTIRVQEELARVQLEIERLRGRLAYLEDQTSFGTIAATFGPVGAAPSDPSPLARALQRALRAAQSVVAALIVGLGYALPVALLAGVVVLVARGLRPRLNP